MGSISSPSLTACAEDHYYHPYQLDQCTNFGYHGVFGWAGPHRTPTDYYRVERMVFRMQRTWGPVGEPAPLQLIKDPFLGSLGCSHDDVLAWQGKINENAVAGSIGGGQGCKPRVFRTLAVELDPGNGGPGLSHVTENWPESMLHLHVRRSLLRLDRCSSNRPGLFPFFIIGRSLSAYWRSDRANCHFHHSEDPIRVPTRDGTAQCG